jgi:methionine-S-sulfoxide reductase
MSRSRQIFVVALGFFAAVSAALLVGQEKTTARSEENVSLPANAKTAIFGGGCFWCMQPPFDSAKGVLKTIVGYTGGNSTDATYDKVSGHKTQHREVVEVTYDPAQISYEQLLDIFWRNINPTQADGQFADIGLSYQAAIYFGSEEEKQSAEASRQNLARSGRFERPIVTEILPRQPFYPAEEYHQKYYKKNPAHYHAYKVGSGRAGFIAKYWGAEE